MSEALASARDREHMAAALELAANGLYDAAPNPTVGCVLVKGDAVVGRGWSAPAGGPHAERVALEQAGDAARGATAYVTLGPCCHFGRTPPCTKALIAAGIERVVYGADDPNPLIDGGGVRELRAAGIDILGGVLAAESEALNRGFFARMRRGRPWVRSKIAATLDGRTALANGASQWITGEAARRDVHRWRALSSAVLTGSGTVVADDPKLDARPAAADLPRDARVKQPLRVIVDAKLRTPLTARTLALPGQVLIFTTNVQARAAWELAAAGAQVEQVAADGPDHCDLGAVLDRLGALAVNDVWVEAGPGLNGALLAAGLIDELIIYLAPRLFGDTARGMFTLPEITAIDQGLELAVDGVSRVGPDLRITARPARVAHP